MKPCTPGLVLALVAALAVPALAHAERQQTRTSDWRGRDVIHCQQRHHGVPVIGAGAVSLADGTPVATTERDTLTVDVTPSISAEDALALARAAVDHADGGSATLSVLPTGSGGRLVYRAELTSWLPARWWMVTVDALTGDVVRVDDLVRRAEGWVYEHNPVLSDLSTVELQDMHSVAGGGTMYGDHAMVCSIVFSGNDIDCVFTATSTGSGDFFHEPDDPSVDDPFVEVMVYHHLTELTHHFMDAHGHEFPDTATAYVNYRESANGTYENAGYANIDGFHLFLFGQGEVMDYGYDGDVIAHEFGHAVVHGRTDLVHGYLATYDDFGGNIAPGALDEGMADYFSCSYHDGAPMGEYVSGGDAMRDLTNDHTCPEDVVGESHGDGQIPGAAMWDIREQLGAEIADALAYEALGLISPSPSLREFADALSLTATDMVDAGELTQADLDTIESILTDRGLYACGRSIPLIDGEPVTLTLGHLEGYGMETLNPSTCNSFRDDGVRFDSRFQWELQLPSADDGEVESIEIELDLQRLDGQDVDSDDLQYEVYGRIDSLVTFDITDIDSPTLTIPLPIPTARSFDGHWDNNPGAIRITRSHLDGMSLAPGTTLYFTAVHMNCPATALTLTPTVTVDQEFVGDDDDDDDGGGCECRAAGGSAGSRAFLIASLLGALALVRRRHGVLVSVVLALFLVWMSLPDPVGAWTLDTPLSQASASFQGEAEGHWLGSRVSDAGDVNGDGYDDFLMGAYKNGEGGECSGQAYLVLGRATGWAPDASALDSDASFVGTTSWDYVGAGLAGAGDVNGDGYDDFLIAAPFDDEGGGSPADCCDGAGQTYLFLGQVAGWAVDTPVTSADASFIGEAANDHAGTVAGGGDVNGDGYDDFLIGASFNGEVHEIAGQVYLVLGRASGWETGVSLADADASFRGSDEGAQAATAAIDGDVTCDGYDDLLIHSYSDEYGPTRGMVSIFQGGPSLWTNDMPLSDAPGTLWGDLGYVAQGLTTLVAGGDVDGDGCDEILVGSPYDPINGPNSGRADLVPGTSAGWATVRSLSDDTLVLEGEATLDEFGYSVDFAGDVDGDGLADLVVGARKNNEAGEAAGQVYLLLGAIDGQTSQPTAVLAASFLGEQSGDWAGDSVSSAGDVNGDGLDDLLIGAYRNGEAGSEAGQVYLLLSDYPSPGDDDDSSQDDDDSSSAADDDDTGPGDDDDDWGGPPGDDDDDGGGCECNGAVTNHVLPTLLLLIASVGLIRRRAG